MATSIDLLTIIDICIKLEKERYKEQARVIWNEIVYPHIKDNKDVFFEMKDIDEYYNGPHISPGARYSYKEIVMIYDDIKNLL